MVAPLGGIKVIDLGTMITAPLAAMMLGDLGADVTKVERKDGGDPFRSFNGSLYSPHFVAFNRNKRTVVLDLQSDADRETLLARVEVADGVWRARTLSRTTSIRHGRTGTQWIVQSRY
jgi:crotonobetainyl-CoA:carnitine CoA-transferase CaiB-like acyl-CoA transferase